MKTKKQTFKGWFRPNQDVDKSESPDQIVIKFGLTKWYPKLDRRAKITLEWKEPG